MKLTSLLAALAVVCGSSAAQAQGYPSRPITMIVPFPAGGPTDTLGRIMSEGMRPSLGQTIVIENVTGAGSTIGVGRAARVSAKLRPRWFPLPGMWSSKTATRNAPRSDEKVSSLEKVHFPPVRLHNLSARPEVGNRYFLTIEHLLPHPVPGERHIDGLAGLREI